MKKLIFAVFFSVKVGAPAGGRKFTATTFRINRINTGDKQLKSLRPSAVGRENCRFFAVFPTILSRLMFFNYVHTASLKSAMLLY